VVKSETTNCNLLLNVEVRNLETWKFPMFQDSVVVWSRPSFFWGVMRYMLVDVFGN